MHIDDIEADLAAGRLRGIEDAFRALVGYPNEDTIEGRANPKALSGLLRRVAEKLQHDTSILPGSTFDLMLELLERDEMPAGATADYATFASVVLAREAHFRDVFVRHA